jgi:hypothetical protein
MITISKDLHDLLDLKILNTICDDLFSVMLRRAAAYCYIGVAPTGVKKG